jgi:hypothetical protein
MKIDKRAAPTARRIHKRGLMKRAYFLSTKKSVGIMQLESRNEADTARALALDPRVVSFRPQPMTIEMNSGRVFPTKEALFEAFRGTGYKPKVYTPDFEVQLAAKSVFMETRASRLIAKHPQILEYPAIFRSFGLELIVIDDSQFPESYRHNLAILSLSVGTRIEPEVAARLTAVLAHGPIAFERVVLDAGVTQTEVLASIALGILECDIVSAELAPTTMVWAAVTGCGHLKRLPF